MNVPVYGVNGEKKSELPLAKAFSTPVRSDVIHRAFLAEASSNRTPYGANPLAGMRTSAHYHGKRHYRYTMMNREMARMKRIHGQGFLNMTARIVPQATKGRKAHPPKAEKKWEQKINKKEKQLALRSALAATSKPEHLPKNEVKSVPLIVEDKFQDLKKTKDILAAMHALGLKNKPKRTLRAGKGTRRGRKYRKKRGPLIITSKNMACPPGCDVVEVKHLTVSDLAPGGTPGRVVLWTESSLKEVEKL